MSCVNYGLPFYDDSSLPLSPPRPPNTKPSERHCRKSIFEVYVPTYLTNPRTVYYSFLPLPPFPPPVGIHIRLYRYLCANFDRNTRVVLLLRITRGRVLLRYAVE